jgi:N-succinyldiaminopimelate aminotransferase
MANPICTTLGPTIFDTMSALARETGAINLGQGFPDQQGPEALRRAAGRALMEGSNQYPPMRGLPVLREAVAGHYARHQDTAFGADGVLVTSGATEAIAASLLALITPGDEVIIFEPAYDAYRPLIARAGGQARAVALQPPGWRIDASALEAAITPRTRAILFNDPLNPAARAFCDEERRIVADACVRHDLYAICDEVWEHVLFDGRAHRSLAALPGMEGRAVKIGSAGKIFSMTGWKVGFACGAPDLIELIARTHQYLTFSTPPALQEAVAEGLSWPQDWYGEMRAGYQRSRDRLAAGLREAGWAVLASEATYFLNIDLAASGLALDDTAFCETIVREHGVAGIPVSAFYGGQGPSHIVRLCFAKKDAVLDAAVERLGRARKALAP